MRFSATRLTVLLLLVATATAADPAPPAKTPPASQPATVPALPPIFTTPTTAPAGPGAEALTKIKRGRLLLQAQRRDDGVKLLEEALADLQVAIKDDPEQSELHFLRAEAFFYLNRDEAALDACTAAIRLSPDNADYHAMKAVILRFADRRTEAVQELKLATKLAPDEAEHWRELGATYYQLRQFDESLAAYEKAVEVNPKDVDALLAAAGLNMERGNDDRALDLFLKVVELRPNQMLALYNAGQLLQRQGKHLAAAELFEKAAKWDKENWRVRAKLVQLYQALGRFEERDLQRRWLFAMRRKGVVPVKKYDRDEFDCCGVHVQVCEHLELSEEEPARLIFAVSESAESRPPERFRILLSIHDNTHQLVRRFPDGRRETFASFQNEPAYEEVRDLVRGIIEGNMAPLSSTGPEKR